MMPSKTKMYLKKRGIWDLKENDTCLAWSWTLEAMILAFSETPDLLNKIRKEPGWHIYAFTKRKISSDIWTGN
jgi:hypothetical protein